MNKIGEILIRVAEKQSVMSSITDTMRFSGFFLVYSCFIEFVYVIVLFSQWLIFSDIICVSAAWIVPKGLKTMEDRPLTSKQNLIYQWCVLF